MSYFMRDSAREAKRELLGLRDEVGGDVLVFWFCVACCVILILNGWA